MGGALTLSDVADALLAEARDHHSRRAANTILTGTSMRAIAALIAFLTATRARSWLPPTVRERP